MHWFEKLNDEERDDCLTSIVQVARDIRDGLLRMADLEEVLADWREVGESITVLTDEEG